MTTENNETNFVWSNHTDDTSSQSIDTQPPSQRPITELLKRERVFRLIFPGEDDPEERISEPLSFSEVITELPAAEIGLRQLEVLIFPGPTRIEYCLCPRTTEDPDEEFDKGGGVDEEETVIDDVSETEVQKPETAEPDERAFGTLQNTCEEVLSSAMGYECRELDFTGLAPPVRTERLAVEDNPNYPVIEDLDYLPDEELFAHFLNTGTPFMMQVIVGFDNGKKHDYTLSVRLAVFEQGRGISSQQDWIEQSRNDDQQTLTDFFYHPCLSSSDTVDLEEYFEIHDSSNLSRREYVRRDKAQAVRTLAKGRKEFDEMLYRTHNHDQAYQHLNLNSKLPIASDVLSYFLRFYHAKYPYSPWDNVVLWDGPAFGDGECLKSAHGTQSDLETDPLTGESSQITTDDSPAGSTASSSSSSPEAALTPHATDALRTARRLLASGFEITILDEDIKTQFRAADLMLEHLGDEGKSVTDIRATKDGTTRYVEISSAGGTKPSNVLTNAMRADHEDADELVFVTDNEKKLAGIFGRPWRDDDTSDRPGVRIYNMKKPEYAISSGEELVVFPSGDAEAHWRLCHDARLQLWYDGEIVAEGPATADPREFEYDLPLAVDGEDGYRIKPVDGNDQIIPDQAFANNYTTVPAPCVPTRLDYLTDLDIQYFDGDELTTHQPRPAWDVESKTSRYRKSIKTYFDSRTVTVDGEEINLYSLRERYWDWYDARTTRKEPNKDYFGTKTPDHIETKARTDADNNKTRYYKNRTYIYPRGLTSPIFPFVEDE